jgi:hypothetical protein
MNPVRTKSEVAPWELSVTADLPAPPAERINADVVDHLEPAWEDDSLSSLVRKLFWFLGLTFGLMEAVASHFSLLTTWTNGGTVYWNTDGLEYLDMARAYLNRDWNSAVNGYWSPLYAWLLGAGIWLSHLSLYWETTIAHAINLLVFVASMAAFEFFLGELCERHRAMFSEEEAAPVPIWAMRAFGYSLCLYGGLVWISVNAITPDECVAAIVYLTAALLLRMQRKNSRWPSYLLLGFVLGIGYLTKAALLPLGLVALLAVPFLPSRISFASRMARTILAGIVFAAVAAPLVIALSRSKGRFTVGDTGKLAYAETIDGLSGTVVWWHGQGDFGTPKHPVRMISTNPPVYEYASPVGGTYPPWYDPSYWLDGAKPYLSMRGQLSVITLGAQVYSACLMSECGFIVGLVALLLLDRGKYRYLQNVAATWPGWIAALAGIGMFLIVAVEPRYVAAFLALVGVCLVSGIRLSPTTRTKRILIGLALGIAAVNFVSIAEVAVRKLPSSLMHPQHTEWDVAQALSQAGVFPGDHVATITDHRFSEYWAHLAQVKVIAEIPFDQAQTLASLDAESRPHLLGVLRQTGAKAVVAGPAPLPQTGMRWTRLGNTDYYFLKL